MKAKTLRNVRFGLALLALTAVWVAFAPAARAQAQFEFTPVPVVIADASSADFTDTETQPHILVVINLDAPGIASPTFIGPPILLAHTVTFPSGDSMVVERGSIMQVAVTATNELALQPADVNGLMFPPPNP